MPEVQRHTALLHDVAQSNVGGHPSHQADTFGYRCCLSEELPSRICRPNLIQEVIGLLFSTLILPQQKPT